MASHPPSPLLRLLPLVLFVATAAAAGWLLWDPEAFAAWREDAGVVPFFLAMAVLPALGVPVTPFFVMAGATFGIRIGLLGSAVALALNLILSYWIAHGGLRPWLESLLARTRYSVPDFGGEGALRFTILVKLAPGVPLFIKHYLLGLAGVPFPIYFGVSAAITGVYATAFVVLGESLLERDVGVGAGAVAVLLFVSAALFVWRRRRGRTGD
ncbi:TVP38/TMEM64 family protein [Coralloluteibacterium thermophilus]|uniref:TVP38/TMEM64 family protein n=1 Tax=Coralloluteibacterium thermophilum TaxID=2707049 RepID=A0ABV9NMW2_9GAMM